MEEFKKIVALTFVRAIEKYPWISSKTTLAKKISEVITRKEGKEPEETYYKTLLIYFDYFFNDGKKQEPTNSIINKFLVFLDYDSIEQFIKNQPTDKSYLEKVPFVKDIQEVEREPEDSTGSDIDNDPPEDIGEGDTGSNWSRRIIISISITIPSIIALYFGINWIQDTGECMTWSVDHYEKVECDSNGISINYNQNWIDNFKKVKYNDSIRDFFEEGGKPLYWYYKRNNKVELFTMSGKHPIRNVELKPITQTIVRKYILKE
ncbi:hypothetical protein [Aquimarina litoralis]|uniref:hypothetical protein n=1 Tax=Aquimarina litoralis TaxID=584605 RepID=UPI001C56D9E3|nr:hypothetical protein [Aquimarina litoralis]MBW1297026.1 hypothetical protein [Aquimarina litoralis]